MRDLSSDQVWNLEPFLPLVDDTSTLAHSVSEHQGPRVRREILRAQESRAAHDPNE